jgi:hypothetical protein
MKSPLRISGFFFILTLGTSASIQIPGANGSSGALHITADTSIDLALAADGLWSDSNTPNGIYDADQWAIVFNYSSVTVDAGATLTFGNHPSRAPVVWLVSGDVTINGTVSLDGQEGQPSPFLSEPGPGGFRGGTATYLDNPIAGAGFGPGGGFQTASSGTSATYAADLSLAKSYGNASLIPLIGGSGGGADPQYTSSRIGGGAGGGALLVACAGTITVNGEMQAHGGAGILDFLSPVTTTGGGSGGAIRLVCDTLAGTGILSAVGGNGGGASDENGGPGRIRIERVSSSFGYTITPDPSLLSLTSGDTATLWPAATDPQVEVLSIGGVTAPADPRSAFGAIGADITLPETNTAQIRIRTTYVEDLSTVEVRLTPRSGGNAQVVQASVDTTVSAIEPILEWVADLPVSAGYSAVQVRVVRP